MWCVCLCVVCDLVLGVYGRQATVEGVRYDPTVVRRDRLHDITFLRRETFKKYYAGYKKRKRKIKFALALCPPLVQRAGAEGGGS